MQYAGYAHLIHHDNISAIAPAISVEVRSVTRKETVGQTIAVPAKLAPAPDDRLGHVLFAIKHEGINLQVLAQALPAIPEPEIRQNAVISNVFSQAVSFRTEQNYLSNGLRGALGVTYVPPAPELSRSLMEQLMALANQPPEAVDPLVLASIVSFGFVFVHPFMDGNGRLSRFLFHQVLCQRGALQNSLRRIHGPGNQTGHRTTPERRNRVPHAVRRNIPPHRPGL